MVPAGSLSGIGDLSSDLLRGMGQNYSWVEDSDAGTVLQCSKVSILLGLHGSSLYAVWCKSTLQPQIWHCINGDSTIADSWICPASRHMQMWT